jgi:hypothetical protein
MLETCLDMSFSAMLSSTGPLLTNVIFLHRNFAIAYATPYMVNADAANLQSKVFFIWGSFW